MKKLTVILSALLIIVVVLSLVFTFGLPEADRDVASFEGKVKYITIEGGFWGIISSDGKNYEPVNLVPAYQTDGLSVSLKARVLENQVGSHQWGTVIKIITIEAITTTNC